MKSLLARENTIIWRILINLGILTSSLLCSCLLVLMIHSFLASQWNYDLDTRVTGDETDLLYNLGKQFQLFGIIVFICLTTLIIIGFFKNVHQKDFSRTARFTIAWFFIILGLITGFTFFFPEGSGLLTAREFYWRAAFPFVIIGIGFTILMTTEVVANHEKGEKLVLWLAMLTMLSIGIFTTIGYNENIPWGQDANHPWILSLSLGAHYLTTFWVGGASFMSIVNKVRFYNSWNDLIYIITCCCSLITFIVASPPFIPRGSTYIELYGYFVMVLILGAISMFLWSITEISKQELTGKE